TTPWPELSELLNRELLNLVGEYNMQRRQSNAAAERSFVEARLEESRHELVGAESDLKSFMEQNRRFDEAPQLRLEAARLQRRVDLRQQVYASLAQAYEQARIEEVRNT